MARYDITIKDKDYQYIGLARDGATPQQAFQHAFTDKELVVSNKDEWLVMIQKIGSNRRNYYNVKDKEIVLAPKKNWNKKDKMVVVYKYLLQHKVGQGASRIEIIDNRIIGRFFTGYDNWYSDYDYDEDKYQILLRGRNIIEEFEKDVKQRFNIVVRWQQNGEKGYSTFFVDL